jgi:hypothetical protein
MTFLDASLLVECSCGARRFFEGPLERVEFVLRTLTSCPCGNTHETLPTAAYHATISKGETP